MRKWFFIILALLIFSLPAIAQDNNTVHMRAAHFSVDAPLVDIYVNGELILEAFDFPQVSDWIEIEAGSYTIDVVPGGAAIEDALLSDDYDLRAGDWATVAVIGEVARNSLAIQALIEDLNNIPEGLTYVSVFHAIPDLDPVNVFVGDIDLVRLLSYPDATGGTDGYVGDAIAPGEYDFDIQAANGNSILTVETSTLGAGHAYFLAAVGTAANPLFVFVPTDVEALNSELPDPLADVETGEGTLLARIGHFSVSAPEVDLYLNGEMLLETVQFGDLTDYMEFEAGIYDVALVPTGEALDNAVYAGRIALVADSITLIAAIGFIGDNSLEVVTASEDNTPPEAGFSRIAFFQAIPSIQLFDLRANGNTLIQGVLYPNIFDAELDGYVPVDIVAGAYEFVVQGAGTTLNVGNVTTGSGRVYLIVATGTETAPVFFLISGNFPSGE